ncbi:MAG TPA: hypothetical protein VFQ43_20555 [Nitrososphaera sp.]|nr:hypothetical protein [Nitrososphaera sp.]
MWPHERAIGPVLERCRSFTKHVLTTQSIDSRTKEKWESLLLILEEIIVVAPSQPPSVDPQSKCFLNPDEALKRKAVNRLSLNI